MCVPLVSSALAASEIALGPCAAQDVRCLHWCHDRVAIDWAAPLSRCSTAAYCACDDDGEGGEAIVVPGYQRIFDHVLAEVQRHARVQGPLLEHAVTSIDWSSQASRVRVCCANGAAFEADRVIVAVPHTCLGTAPHAIAFHPPPPEAWLQAHQETESGLMDLVVLWFPHVFWPAEATFLGVARAEDEPTQFSTFLAPMVRDVHGQPVPILVYARPGCWNRRVSPVSATRFAWLGIGVAHVGGDCCCCGRSCQVVGAFAEELESLSEARVAAAATSTLRRMLDAPGQPSLVPEPIGCLRSAWRAEPWARGSWSVTTPGPLWASACDIMAQDLGGMWWTLCAG